MKRLKVNPIYIHVYITCIEAIDINRNKFYFNVKIKKYVKNMQKFFNNYIVLYYLNPFSSLFYTKYLAKLQHFIISLILLKRGIL